MKIKIIGCGSAFSQEMYNQCFMVTETHEGVVRNLFIDMGQQIVPFALKAAGLTVNDIDDIWISHLHSDHIGSLEAVAFQRYDWASHTSHWKDRAPKCKAPRLIAKKNIIEALWDQSLRGGLKNSMQWFDATLESFFEVVPVTTITFEWQGWTCTPIQQVHINAFAEIAPSYGLMMARDGHETVYFTTDSQHVTPRQMVDYYAKCKMIFQDCETLGVNFQFPEGTKVYKDLSGKYHQWPTDDMEIMELIAKGVVPEDWSVYKFGSGVHANYGELAGYSSANAFRLKPEVKAKIWLSHYGDHVVAGKDSFGNSVDWSQQATKDGFAGFVSVGQEFEV